MAVQSSESLAVVVGGNCRRIRTTIGMTQDELARFARAVGLRWTASVVGDFEAGRSAPTLATVLAVLLALQMGWERRHPEARPEIDVTLEELVRVGGFVELNDGLEVPGRDLAALCSGGEFVTDRIRRLPSDAAAAVKAEPVEGVSAILQRSGLAEDRLARRLSINSERVARVSFGLWQSTFSEERDRRAGADANQQKRGRVSRELRAELEKALADGDD